jgi:hypothetical protein
MPLHSKLEEDEEIILGPQETKVSKKRTRTSGVQSITPSSELKRTVAVSTRRILVESGSRMVAIPNYSVKIVHLKEKMNPNGESTYTLERVNCQNGQIVHLGLSLPSQDSETLVRQLFPDAGIHILTGSIWLWLIAVAVLLVLLAIIFIPILIK